MINCLHEQFKKIKDYIYKVDLVNRPTLECMNKGVILNISLYDTSEIKRSQKPTLNHKNLFKKIPNYTFVKTNEGLQFSTDVRIHPSIEVPSLDNRFFSYKINFNDYAYNIFEEGAHFVGSMRFTHKNFSKIITLHYKFGTEGNNSVSYTLGSINQYENRSESPFWLTEIPIIGYFFKDIRKVDKLKKLRLVVKFREFNLD